MGLLWGYEDAALLHLRRYIFETDWFDGHAAAKRLAMRRTSVEHERLTTTRPSKLRN